MSTALLVVDLQIDFLPGGALAVPDGDAILEPVAALMTSHRFDLIVATQDWHAPGHISFASSHEGHQPFDTITLYGKPQVLWPDHCVAGTPGAALHPRLPWERVSAVLRKATDPQVDSYSGFRNNWNAQGTRPPTGLAGYLRERGIELVCICGLARDYCVKWTAEDAVDLGFKTRVLWDASRAIDPTTDDKVRSSLIALGVEIVALSA